MKYKLLGVSKTNKINGVVNIGDYIQALASSQYFPKIDGFVDRDTELNVYNDDECAIIMNGWYMHNPENWPPSNKIHPLFVAFHLNITAKDVLTSPESIAYLKKNEPIGCRDLDTMNTLKSKGVKSYFSACMTLTLGKLYGTKEKDDKTYIVDPLLNKKIEVRDVVFSFFYVLLNLFDIVKLCAKKDLFITKKGIINKLIRVCRIALFHKEYSRVFTRKVVVNSEYISQENQYWNDKYKTDEERLQAARSLVELYARATMVITSRIHCALPCLGLGTPVIFIENGNDIDASKCRLKGLGDLFNKVTIIDGIINLNFEANLPITPYNCPRNKTAYMEYANSMDLRCTDFVSSFKR